MPDDVVTAPDVARMNTDRQRKLAHQLAVDGAAAVVMFGTTNVRWATGAKVVAADQGRSAHFRNVAVVLAGDPVPHLFTHFREGVPATHASDHVHPGLDVEDDAGAAALVSFVAGHVERHERVLIDEWTMAFRRAWSAQLPEHHVDDAVGRLVGPAKLVKTPDELACIRDAQHVNELAMYDVAASLRAGMRQCELSGIFLRRVMELGADQNTVDPIWQVMPPSVAAGPSSVTGDVVFPTVTTERVLERGDVVWVDAGITRYGYDSDFGRTWIVDAEPTPAQHDQFRRWMDVVDAVLAVTKPGATGRDLCRAAIDAGGTARRPWLTHLYLAHGIGVDSAEAPFIGTDLGPDFDASTVLVPGMVFVLEPVAWEDGTGGYRAEEIVAVTDTGYELLSAHPYEPYVR